MQEIDNTSENEVTLEASLSLQQHEGTKDENNQHLDDNGVWSKVLFCKLYTSITEVIVNLLLLIYFRATR